MGRKAQAEPKPAAAQDTSLSSMMSSAALAVVLLPACLIFPLAHGCPLHLILVPRITLSGNSHLSHLVLLGFVMPKAFYHQHLAGSVQGLHSVTVPRHRRVLSLTAGGWKCWGLASWHRPQPAMGGRWCTVL